MDDRPRSGRRLTFGVATLLGLVAVSALVFRGCLTHHGLYTVRLVNDSRTAVVDVAVVRGDRRIDLGVVGPGQAIEAPVRFPDPSEDFLTFRAHDSETPTEIRLDPLRFGIGPRSGGFEVRVTTTGLQMSVSGNVGFLP